MTVTPHSYAMDYEFRGDSGDYTPTDAERAMIEDAICGYIAAADLNREAFMAGWDMARGLTPTPAPADKGAVDRLPDGHTVLEQADLTDCRVSQTVRIDATGEEYERIVHHSEAYGDEE